MNPQDPSQFAVGRIAEKVWGQTRCLICGHGFEIHYLEIKSGTHCSRHRHGAKWNQFFVIRGVLKVKFFHDDGSEKETWTLHPGGMLRVKPGEIHRFECVEDCEAIEMYWTDPVDPNDIQRFDVGGFVSPVKTRETTK